MILNLPYAQKISCVPPGRTKTYAYDVWDVRPFEVPEASDAEAPGSCRLRGITYRSWGGRAYRSLDVTAAEIEARLTTVQQHRGNRNLFDALVARSFSGRAVAAENPFDRPSRTQELAGLVRGARRGGGIKELTDDAEAASALAQVTWARRLLMIDGRAWVAAPEPRHNLDMVHTAVILQTGVAPNAEARWTIPFRADRKEEAKEYGRLVASRTKGRWFRDDVYEDGEIEVLSPEHLTFAETDAMAAWIYDVTNPREWNGARWNGGRRIAEPPAVEHHLDEGALNAKRYSDDPTWAYDVLDTPDLVARAEQARQGLATERKPHREGTKVLRDAWVEVFRPKVAALAALMDEDLSGFDPDPKVDEGVATFSP